MRSIELFAGAGGLAVGTARAGFDHEVVIEWDHDACETLRLNADADHGHGAAWEVIEGDVRKYDFRPHQGRIASHATPTGGPNKAPLHVGRRDGASIATAKPKAADWIVFRLARPRAAQGHLRGVLGDDRHAAGSSQPRPAPDAPAREPCASVPG